MPDLEKHYLGLDVGRTIRGALIREDGQIIEQRRVVTEVRNPRVFIDQLIDMINGLRSLERVGRRVLVSTGDRGLDLLHEAANAAHARPVDLGALVVAADALLGLRRVGHVCPYLGPLCRAAGIIV